LVVVIVAMPLESLSWSSCKPPYINIVNLKKITHICIFHSWKIWGLLRCLLRPVAQIQVAPIRDLLLSSTRIRNRRHRHLIHPYFFSVWANELQEMCSATSVGEGKALPASPTGERLRAASRCATVYNGSHWNIYVQDKKCKY
jgi:hypothetical protein